AATASSARRRHTSATGAPGAGPHVTSWHEPELRTDRRAPPPGAGGTRGRAAETGRDRGRDRHHAVGRVEDPAPHARRRRPEARQGASALRLRAMADALRRDRPIVQHLIAPDATPE